MGRSSCKLKEAINERRTEDEEYNKSCKIKLRVILVMSFWIAILRVVLIVVMKNCEPRWLLEWMNLGFPYQPEPVRKDALEHRRENEVNESEWNECIVRSVLWRGKPVRKQPVLSTWETCCTRGEEYPGQGVNTV